MNRLFDIFKEIKIDESIIVNGSPNDIFTFVTDIDNSGKISDHVVDVEPFSPNSSTEGFGYKRRLLIHGSPNEQIVNVRIADENAKFITSTELYGFDVVYTYRFIPLDDLTVKIDLTKEAKSQGFWKILTPLLTHLLTRPEHDGRHLLILKNAVEAGYQ